MLTGGHKMLTAGGAIMMFVCRYLICFRELTTAGMGIFLIG